MEVINFKTCVWSLKLKLNILETKLCIVERKPQLANQICLDVDLKFCPVKKFFVISVILQK